MPYINYNENGSITAVFENKQYEDQLYFDIPNDGKIYKVSNNKLIEDTDATKVQLVKSAMATRDAIIDSVTNSVLLDQLQLATGLITQSVYDSRKTAKTTIYSKAIDDFYTTTGLTKPTTIGA